MKISRSYWAAESVSMIDWHELCRDNCESCPYKESCELYAYYRCLLKRGVKIVVVNDEGVWSVEPA